MGVLIGIIKKIKLKRLLKLLTILVFTNIIYAQETKSPNTIIYFETFGGFSVITDAGFGGGFEINYQNKKDLFSFRLIEVAGYSKEAETAYLPSYIRTNHNNEYAFLYGKRWLQNNHSYSISSGLSYNHFISNTSNSDYIGLPLEANIIWFSSKKKNTIENAITPKFGFKLFGNISKNSFVGVGISLGVGYHKNN